jgi:acyl carrier protein
VPALLEAATVRSGRVRGAIARNEAEGRAMGQATTVRTRIRSFIAETFFVDDFADDEFFLRAGIIDSMGMLQLVTFLQEAFEIEILEEELVPDNLDSLARATAFVERKLKGRSAA